MEKAALPKTAPALVIPYGEDKKFQAFCDLSQPNNTTCRESIPELKGKSYYQKNSHQGWLIVLCDDEEFDYTPWEYGDCFLWNPSSMETINLPSLLDQFDMDSFWFLDCVLSSPPKSSTGTKNENSIVLVLFGGEKNDGLLVFCHPGDEEWRDYLISREDFYDIGVYDYGEPESIGYFQGKFHLMCRGSNYLEIRMQDGSEPKVLYVKTSCKMQHETTFYLGSNHKITYYLETSDGIFRIDKVYIPRGVPEYCVTNLVISKLDISFKNKGKKKKKMVSWVKVVTSFGDHVFFLNQYTQLSCSAKELGLTRGAVYFTQPDDMSFYMYDLKDNSITLSLPCPDLPKPWFSPNWLRIPTTLGIGEKRKVTEHLLGDGIQTLKDMVSTINLTDDNVKETVGEAKPYNEIVWLVSNYLNPVDYIHYRAACKTYRSIIEPLANQRKSCSIKCLETTSLSPWLVSCKDKGAVYSFINPMHNNENYLMSIPQLLHGSTIHYSKGGWLLMSKGLVSVFLYNPFTKAIIKLPDIPKDYFGYTYKGTAFSSLPTSSDCVCFAIRSYLYDEVEICYIKRGDKEWIKHRAKNVYLPPNTTNIMFEPSLNSPIFYNGAFYCLDVNGILGVCTIGNGIKWEVLSMVPQPNCDFIYESYLVEFEGKLLSVLLGKHGEWVRLFTLDMAEKVWVEVKHLGRHTLFIGNTSCIATIAPTSRMENKIYFPRLKNERILYYSLDSGEYRSLESEHSETDYCNSKHNLWCSWIEPNWSETTKSIINWY